MASPTTAIAPRPRIGRGDGSWMPSVVLLVGLLVLWEVAAGTVLAGSKAFPPLSDVLAEVTGDVDTYARHVRATFRAAWPGWLLGSAVTLVTACVPTTAWRGRTGPRA